MLMKFTGMIKQSSPRQTTMILGGGNLFIILTQNIIKAGVVAKPPSKRNSQCMAFNRISQIKDIEVRIQAFMKNLVIEVKNVSKTYGDFVALDNISFDVKQGEIFGLIPVEQARLHPAVLSQ